MVDIYRAEKPRRWIILNKHNFRFWDKLFVSLCTVRNIVFQTQLCAIDWSRKRKLFDIIMYLLFRFKRSFWKKKTWIAIRCCSLVRFRRSRLWLGEWRFFTSELCKVITSAASAFAFLLSFYFVFVCFIKNNFNNLDCSVVTGKSQISAYCIDLASLRQCGKASSVQF